MEETSRFFGLTRDHEIAFRLCLIWTEVQLDHRLLLSKYRISHDCKIDFEYIISSVLMRSPLELCPDKIASVASILSSFFMVELDSLSKTVQYGPLASIPQAITWIRPWQNHYILGIVSQLPPQMKKSIMSLETYSGTLIHAVLWKNAMGCQAIVKVLRLSCGFDWFVIASLPIKNVDTHKAIACIRLVNLNFSKQKLAFPLSYLRNTGFKVILLYNSWIIYGCTSCHVTSDWAVSYLMQASLSMNPGSEMPF